jgi:hypothetical protein
MVTLFPANPTPFTIAFEAAGGRCGLKNLGRISLSLSLVALSET